MGLFGTFEIARSGMYTNERGLYVTGHNLSNTNTDGYTRQQIQSSTAAYRNLPGIGDVGLGSDIQGIRQIRNNFLDGIYRNEVEDLGYYQMKNKTFQDIQSILDEPLGDGLQNVMNQFWDSWQELSKEPDSLTVRALVRQRGEALGRQVNHIGSQLEKMQNDINQEINLRINEVNEMTKQVAVLNREILEVEVAGDDANDMRDKRNLLMDKLSRMVGADFDDLKDGQINVVIGGQLIVNRTESFKIYTEESKEYGMFYMPKLEGSNIELDISNGEFKGLLESRGVVFGSTGSEENGSPNTKVDINFVIDKSDTSADYLDKVKGAIKTYVNELENTGLDYNLRLISYSDRANVDEIVWDKDNIRDGFDSFEQIIDDMFVDGASENNFVNLVNEMDIIEDYREDASKYAIVFTKESIDGNEGHINEDEKNLMLETLSNKGIKVSVVSDMNYYEAGTLGEVGWKSLTEATEGEFYDIDAEDYNGLMTMINRDINANKNDEIDFYEESTNIIPDLKKRLNALVNVMFREINYLHTTGYTLDEEPGEDFFVPIDDSIPLEMGNIKVNPEFSDLDKIVASGTTKNGDNEVALTIANLRNAKILGDKTGPLSIDDFYQAIVMKVGTESAETDRITENQEKLVNSANDFRKSITDVSMDEEMTNMMKYKYAYGASSRLINIVNDMLDTVIQRIGG